MAKVTTTRAEVEDFLFEEADLLDKWRLPEWLTLFTEDAVYHVPTMDISADASPDESLFYIADDRFRLGERVKRLMKRTAHVEFPHSKTRHMVSNVRIRPRDDEDIDVMAVFATYRTKDGVTDTYVGTSEYRITQSHGAFKIRSKRCVLDSDALRPSGRISIIL
ncbi:aromatic-ring-hydroxylating dioxygenase subunit beta [Bradyrhizobium sp. RDT10]